VLGDLVSTAARKPWLIHFFKRHHGDDPTESVPALRFLQACPVKVEAMMLAVIQGGR
jgi:hypothetical protein